MGARDKPAALVQAFDTICGRGFDWRKRNCGLGAASMVAAMLRRDFAAPYREECSSALAAMRLLKRKGGFAGIMAELALVEINLLQAQRGDVVLYAWTSEKGKPREALGVAMDYRAAFPGVKGMEMIPLARCSRAWRQPEGICF